ncbi:fimbrial protein [Providencia sp. Je.9.19]|uniref:fimbrial protein n=1 Tax=unclassified Providencia TaxID=2633465 RepID=UPI003DA85383
MKRKKWPLYQPIKTIHSLREKGVMMIRMRIGILFSCLAFSALASNSTNVSIAGNLIVNPACELTSTTGEETIFADFGEIVISKMGTSTSARNYRKTLPYKVVCDAPEGTGIYIQLRGESASFNPQFVATTNENVGILFLNKNALITPTGYIAGMKLGNETVMEVVPVRNGATGVKVATGDFSATATLTVFYQ